MSKSRIMVVDGSSVSREIVVRILGDILDDSEITSCSSGRQALEQLAHGHYQLITTSLVLPDMDGLDLCKAVRQSAGHSHTPLIVVSGDADQRRLRERFAAGVTDCFDKSQGYPAFGAFIKAFCQRNSGVVGRILFVEDSQTAATVTTRMLERHGLQVTHVTSGEAALPHLEALWHGDEQYDLVITDYHLEGAMTGSDVLHAIRGRFHFSQQQLPVLLITSKDDMQTQVESFYAGANDFIHKPLIAEILLARVRSMLLIKQQYEALQHQSNSIEQAAYADTLTGVLNRRYLLDHGPTFLAESDNQPLWALLIDIDNIRQINETHGHLVGDHVLAAVGSTLRDHFPEGVPIRFGGEEFALLLPNAQARQALARAERFRQQIEQLRPDNVTVTISIGMACAQEHPQADLNQLIGLADRALQCAKQSGRNRLCHTDSQGELRQPRFQASA